MLNLARRADRFHRDVRPLAEILPWLMALKPDVILNKDGGLLACFEVEGINPEGGDSDSPDQAAESLEQALRGLDHHFTLWSTVLRRPVSPPPPGGFDNPASARIEGLHLEALGQWPGFENRHYLSLLQTPEHPTGGWMGLWSQTGRRRGKTKDALFHDAAARRASEQMARRLTRFEEQLDQFAHGCRGLGLRRMTGASLLGLLHETTSPAGIGGSTPVDPEMPYLDGLLGENQVRVEADRIRFDGVDRQVYGAALAIKSWPTETFPGLLDEILQVPAALTLSQVFRIVDTDQAKRYIKNVQRFHLNFQKSLFSYVRQAIGGEESVVRDTSRSVNADEARQALTDMAAARRTYGYMNFTVMVFCTDSDRLETLLGAVARVVRSQGFLMLRERLHLNSAWSGTLPGQWGELVRWQFVSTANWADLCPLLHLPSGRATNAYLGAQTGRPAPALTTLRTATGGYYHFNLHQQDLAHTFVVGPSRSGKSVWVNFLISQFQRYHPVHTVIFDKDRSCRIPTLLQGGQCIDVGRQGVPLNPLLVLTQPAGRQWLAGWLELLLGSPDQPLGAPERRALQEALDGLASLPRDWHRLRSLAGLLPSTLSLALEPWLEGGVHGTLFDHPGDGFELSSFTCLEMGDVLRQPVLARAFLDYAFFRVDQRLSQGTVQPTLIYVEEAWFMLADPLFAGRIRDWLKTLPKKLGFVILATQSLDDLSSSTIFSTIADNVPTRLFLPNRNVRAHRALYQGQFGLTQVQMERIERAQPKGQYFLQTPTDCLMLEAQFTPALLAWLRSDAKAQHAFDTRGPGAEGGSTQGYLSALQEDA